MGQYSLDSKRRTTIALQVITLKVKMNWVCIVYLHHDTASTIDTVNRDCFRFLWQQKMSTD